MTMGIYGIYDDKGCVYVGQSVDIELRWKAHINKTRRGCHANPHLQNILRGENAENLEWKILEVVNDRGALTTRELYWISELCPRCNLVIPDESDSWQVSEETRQKLSESHRGYVMPEEQKEKIRQSNLISQNTPKAKKSKSEALAKRNIERGGTPGYGTYGKHLSEETRQKISKANKGRVVSEETREKLSRSLKGKQPWIKGRHHTRETKKLLSEINKARYSNPEERKKISEATKKAMQRPEVKERVAQARKKGVSEETRKKMSLAKIGKKQSPESIEKRAAANRGKHYRKPKAPFTIDEWYEMRKTMTIGEIERKYGVSSGKMKRWRRELGIQIGKRKGA